MNNLHILCCTDDKYAPFCGAMLASLCDNSNSKFVIHIFIEKLSNDNKDKLTETVSKYGSSVIFHSIERKELDCVQFRMNRPLTRAAYYRILTASVIDKTVDKILYLDCDIIVKRDVAYLFNIDLTGYGLAAIKDLDSEPINDEHRFQLGLSYDNEYFNSGFMMINLDYWRSNDVERKLVEFSSEKRTVYFHDQDALNYVFRDKWFILPPQTCYLNLCLYKKIHFKNGKDFYAYKYNPIVIHYAATWKPWHDLFFFPYKKDFMKYYSEGLWKDLPLMKFQNKWNAYARIVAVKISNVIYGSPIFVQILFDFILYTFLTIIGKNRIYTKWK